MCQVFFMVFLASNRYESGTKAWNRHKNSKFEVDYLEVQTNIYNPNYVFRILNIYLEFQTPIQNSKEHIWN